MPLLYQVFGNDWARVSAQWTIGTIAWLSLAGVLWRLLASGAAKVLAAAAVLLTGLTSVVTSWDFAILSESLSLSLGVFVLAALLYWAKTRSWLALVALTASGFWMTFTRPDMAAVTAVVAVCVVVCGWRQRAALVGAAVVIAAMGWSLAIGPSAEKTFQGWSATGLPQAEETFLYRLRLEILPYPQTLSWYEEKLAMPQCPGAKRVADGQPWAIEEFSREYQACPELKAWAREHMHSAGYQLALQKPDLYLTGLARSAPAMFSGSGYGAAYAKPVHVMPAVAERLVFQPRGVVLVVLLCGSIVGLIAEYRLGASRRSRFLVGIVALLGVASVFSAAVTLMYSAGELSRLGIQEAVLLRLSILVLWLLSLDTYLTVDRTTRVTGKSWPSQRLESVTHPSEAFVLKDPH